LLPDPRENDLPGERVGDLPRGLQGEARVPDSFGPPEFSLPRAVNVARLSLLGFQKGLTLDLFFFHSHLPSPLRGRDPLRRQEALTPEIAEHPEIYHAKAQDRGTGKAAPFQSLSKNPRGFHRGSLRSLRTLGTPCSSREIRSVRPSRWPRSIEGGLPPARAEYQIT